MIKIDPVIMVKGIAAAYQDTGGRIIKAVDGVTLSVARGETLGLVGESGSGKTTLGKIISGLILPERGSFYRNGKRVKPGLHRDVQMVFQDSASALNPRLKVASLVEEGLLIQKAGSKRQREEQVLSMLCEVGLQEEMLTRYPWELSGGQRQRVALARTLLVLPQMVVLDEPVSALDVTAGARLLSLLLRIQENYGVAYLFISHNLAAVRQICHSVAVMYLGKIVEYGRVETVYTVPAHAYTRSLLAAHPRPDPKLAVERLCRSEPVDPFAVPTGCRFHLRCPVMLPKCRLLAPALTEITAEHFVACHQAVQNTYKIHSI